MNIVFNQKTEKIIRELYKLCIKHEKLRSLNDKNPLIIAKNIDEAVTALSEFIKFCEISDAKKQTKLVEEILIFVDSHYAGRLDKSGELASRRDTLIFWENGIHFLEFIHNEPQLFKGNINKNPAIADLLSKLKKMLPKIHQELGAYKSAKKRNGNTTSDLSKYVFKITNSLMKEGLKQEPTLIALDKVLSTIFVSGLRYKGGYQSILRLYKRGKKIKKDNHLP